jgi:valine--pyruvate aminotransferase
MEQDIWSHKDECIRVTYAQDDEVVKKGLSRIATEVKEIYSEL